MERENREKKMEMKMKRNERGNTILTTSVEHKLDKIINS